MQTMTICNICDKAIQGKVEEMTAQDSGNGKAHFYCKFPNGTNKESLPITKANLMELMALDNQRSQYFGIAIGM